MQKKKKQKKQNHLSEVVFKTGTLFTIADLKMQYKTLIMI